MVDQILLMFLSAILGAAVGTLASLYIPRWLFDPRLKIVGIEHRSKAFTLVVVNKGKIAAMNASGRLTIRHIENDDLDPETASDVDTSDDWRVNKRANLFPKKWKVGIESEYVLWNIIPNPVKLNINSGLAEKLLIGRSDGTWIDITAESAQRKRARLLVTRDKTYYGEVIITAENCQAARPFRFTIRLDNNSQVLLQRYEGKLPPARF